MPIEYRISKSHSNEVNVGLEITGLTIRLTPGTVRIGDKTLEMTEAFEHTVTPIADNHLYVGIYLAERKDNGALEFVVDEVPGGAIAFNFSHASSQYIARANTVMTEKIPAGATSLDNIEVVLGKIERIPAPVMPSMPPPRREEEATNAPDKPSA